MFPPTPKIQVPIPVYYVSMARKYLHKGHHRSGGEGGGHIFMKHVQFCILTGNEKEMSSDVSDTHINCNHLTIIYAGLEPGVSI